MSKPVPIELRIGAPPEPAVATGPGPDTEPGSTVPDDWGPALEEVPEADPVAVRAILELIGESMHSLGTVLPTGRVPMLQLIATEELVPDHWKFTSTELDLLTPPVTRIINARPALRAAVQKADHVIIAKAIFGWGSTNMLAGVAARQIASITTEEWEHNGHQQREAPSSSGPAHRSDDGRGSGPDDGQVWADGPVGAGIFPPAD